MLPILRRRTYAAYKTFVLVLKVSQARLLHVLSIAIVRLLAGCTARLGQRSTYATLRR